MLNSLLLVWGPVWPAEPDCQAAPHGGGGGGAASRGSAQAPPWGGQMAWAAAHAFLRTLQVPFIASPALSPHEMQCRAGSAPGGGDTWGRRGQAAVSASLKQPAL